MVERADFEDTEFLRQWDVQPAALRDLVVNAGRVQFGGDLARDRISFMAHRRAAGLLTTADLSS